MGQKYVIAFLLLSGATFAGVLVTCASKRARDVFFFLMIPFAAITEHLDVNFVSRDWYRGTTQGFEASLVDVLSISLLVSAILAPRRGERRFYWPASLGLMLLMFAYCCFSVSIAEPKLWGLFELSKMVRGLIIFVAAALYVRGERELRIMLWGLGCAVCFEALLALKQRYLGGVHRVFGTLDAPNSLSMYMCMTAPVFVTILTSKSHRFLKAVSAGGDSTRIHCGDPHDFACRTGRHWTGSAGGHADDGFGQNYSAEGRCGDAGNAGSGRRAGQVLADAEFAFRGRQLEAGV